MTDKTKCESWVQNRRTFRRTRCTAPAVMRMVSPKTGQATNVCRKHAQMLGRRGWLLVGVPS